MLNINFISFFLFQVDEKNKEKSVQWLIIEKLKGVGLGGVPRTGIKNGPPASPRQVKLFQIN